MSEKPGKEEILNVCLEFTKTEKAMAIYALESYKAYIAYREISSMGLGQLMRGIYNDLKSTIRLMKTIRTRKKGSGICGNERDINNLISSLHYLKNFFLSYTSVLPENEIKYKFEIVRIDAIFEKIRTLVESNNDFRHLKYLLP